MGERFRNMNFQEFVSQMTLAYPRFMRFLVVGLFKDIVNGDIAASGRILVRLSIFQATFVGVETTVLAVIVGKIAFSIAA